MGDHKSRVEKAMERYLTKDESPGLRLSKFNKKPEFELTYKPVKVWFHENGFSMHRVESRAVRGSDGNFHQGMTVEGFPDMVGSDPYGMGCYAELKAPGRRSALRDAQREFLLEKIRRGSFAVVTDSVEHLSTSYWYWRNLINQKMFTEAKTFLFENLPEKRMTGDPIFKDE